jgi:hypothetical protein
MPTVSCLHGSLRMGTHCLRTRPDILMFALSAPVSAPSSSTHGSPAPCSQKYPTSPVAAALPKRIMGLKADSRAETEVVDVAGKESNKSQPGSQNSSPNKRSYQVSSWEMLSVTHKIHILAPIRPSANVNAHARHPPALFNPLPRRTHQK